MQNVFSYAKHYLSFFLSLRRWYKKYQWQTIIQKKSSYTTDIKMRIYFLASAHSSLQEGIVAQTALMFAVTHDSHLQDCLYISRHPITTVILYRLICVQVGLTGVQNIQYSVFRLITFRYLLSRHYVEFVCKVYDSFKYAFVIYMPTL